jgi:hypothetical protein
LLHFPAFSRPFSVTFPDIVFCIILVIISGTFSVSIFTRFSDAFFSQNGSKSIHPSAPNCDPEGRFFVFLDGFLRSRSQPLQNPSTIHPKSTSGARPQETIQKYKKTTFRIAVGSAWVNRF